MTDFRHLGTLILVLRRGIERERERIARAEIRIAEYRAELTELGIDPDTGEPNATGEGRGIPRTLDPIVGGTNGGDE